MKLSDFEEKKSTLVCGRCGTIGLETYKQPNAGGVGARCPACGSKAPLAPEIWFSQNGTSDHVRRLKHDTHKVWRDSGGRCSFCGKSEAICKILKIGLQAHHINPPLFGGPEDGPLVPICARCHEMVRAFQMETRDVERVLIERPS